MVGRGTVLARARVITSTTRLDPPAAANRSVLATLFRHKKCNARKASCCPDFTDASVVTESSVLVAGASMVVAVAVAVVALFDAPALVLLSRECIRRVTSASMAPFLPKESWVVRSW